MSDNSNYQPFGEEWFAYWMKLPKPFILSRFKEWFGKEPDVKLTKRKLLELLAEEMKTNPL